jgi:hypothetical protein
MTTESPKQVGQGKKGNPDGETSDEFGVRKDGLLHPLRRLPAGKLIDKQNDGVEKPYRRKIVSCSGCSGPPVPSEVDTSVS